MNDTRVQSTRRSDRSARICVPTARNFKKVVFQAALYEAQDVLAEVDDADIVEQTATRRFRYLYPLQRKLLWYDVSDRLALLNPGLRQISLGRTYDVLILMCQNWWDLLHINSITDWRGRCGTTLCYIDELYAWEPAVYRHWLPALARFDHIVLGMSGSIEALEKATGKRCHYVPIGIDAMRFAPTSRPLQRVVDVYSIGRRWPGMHEALLKHAERTGEFYVFDVLNGVADAAPACYRQYRTALANMLKRTRHFIVGPAKLASFEQTRGQQEVGYRYFEGAAAGAVLIGQAPETPAFQDLFGWEDSIVQVDPSGADVSKTLEALQADPDRLAAISRRNSCESLLRHDWVYRWKQILAIAGLEPSRGMRRREEMLGQRALEIMASAGS